MFLDEEPIEAPASDVAEEAIVDAPAEEAEEAPAEEAIE